MADTDTLLQDEDTKQKNNITDDLSGLTSDLCVKIPIKMSILLFLLILIVNSDVFIENIMNRTPYSLILAGQPTSLGVVVQASIIVLTFILMSVFSSMTS